MARRKTGRNTSGDKDAERGPRTRAHEAMVKAAKAVFSTEHEERAQHLYAQLLKTLQQVDTGKGTELDGLATALQSMAGFKPRDEVERMLAAQMLAVHEASMECFRRAMVPEQTFEARDMNLKHAAKLTSTYARQIEALGKHRGKGKQKITVEHVNVHAGGQAIVGNVEAGAKAGPSDDAPKPAKAQRALEDGSAASLDGEELKQALKPRKAPAPKGKP
ncbi:hypothetical protein [Altererythrobacter sp. GH1-8]|uniref:hypothetical protein n=1 Tax=Altererythrobacter sp. GH1-8 TaxID=3349333 RepID=UPI00374D8015